MNFAFYSGVVVSIITLVPATVFIQHEYKHVHRITTFNGLITTSLISNCLACIMDTLTGVFENRSYQAANLFFNALSLSCTFYFLYMNCNGLLAQSKWKLKVLKYGTFISIFNLMFLSISYLILALAVPDLVNVWRGIPIILVSGVGSLGITILSIFYCIEFIGYRAKTAILHKNKEDKFSIICKYGLRLCYWALFITVYVPSMEIVGAMFLPNEVYLFLINLTYLFVTVSASMNVILKLELDKFKESGSTKKTSTNPKGEK